MTTSGLLTQIVVSLYVVAAWTFQVDISSTFTTMIFSDIDFDVVDDVDYGALPHVLLVVLGTEPRENRKLIS